jgi:hypothetical protein
MLIPQYMARLDSGDFSAAMELVEPNIQFNLFLPNTTISGNSKEELLGYVKNRPDVVRIHNVLQTAGNRAYEAVYGVVTDDGQETGAFQASGRISDNGRIERYLVYFDLDVRLFELQ